MIFNLKDKGSKTALLFKVQANRLSHKGWIAFHLTLGKETEWNMKF